MVGDFQGWFGNRFNQDSHLLFKHHSKIKNFKLLIITIFQTKYYKFFKLSNKI